MKDKIRDLPLQFLGLVPWASSGKWKIRISKIYIINLKVSLPVVVLFYIPMLCSRSNSYDLVMKLLWQLIGLFLTLIQLIICHWNAKRIFDKLIYTEEESELNVNITVPLRKKVCKSVIKYLLTFLLLVPTAIGTRIASESTYQTDDGIEFIIKYIPLPHFLACVLATYLNLCVFQILIVNVGVNMLLYYSAHKIETLLEHLNDSFEKVVLGPAPIYIQVRPQPRSPQLSYCIRLHHFIIRMVSDWNKAFSILILMLLTRIFFLMIASYEYNKNVQKFDVEKIEKFLMLRSAAPELFTLCAVGHEIKLFNERVRNACLVRSMESVLRKDGVIRTMRSERRILNVVADRCQHPMYLRVGPFIKVSLDLFIKVMIVTEIYHCIISLASRR